MAYYEYKVVPAPRTAPRAKGVKGTENRFAHGLTEVMNTHSAEGWEYHRAETLTCEGRRGLFSRAPASTQQVLVFRRWVETSDAVFDFGSRLRSREEDVAPETLGAELGRPGGAPQRAEPAARSARDAEPSARPGRAAMAAGKPAAPAPVASKPAITNPISLGPRERRLDASSPETPGKAPALGPAREDVSGDPGLRRFPGTPERG